MRIIILPIGSNRHPYKECFDKHRHNNNNNNLLIIKNIQELKILCPGDKIILGSNCFLVS